MGCVKGVLANAESWPNKTVKKAIAIVNRLKMAERHLFLEKKAAEEYRLKLLKEAAEHLLLI